MVKQKIGQIMIAVGCILLLSRLAQAENQSAPRVSLTDKSQTGAKLGDQIVLRVDNLDSLMALAETAGKNVIPFVEGYPLKGVRIFRLDSATVRFTLRRTKESQDVWMALLQKPGFYARNAALSLGVEDGVAVQTSATDFQITVIRKGQFIGCLIGLVAILIALCYLARHTAILRDAGPRLPGGQHKSYSLARTQMAVWFMLIISAYLILWILTGQLGTITESMLALMGIGSGTALGAAIVDAGKRNAASEEINNLVHEKAVLEETLTRGGNKQIKAVMASRLDSIDQRMKSRTVTQQGQTSEGFWNDILTDANGISFHRFQIAVWTVVLVFIFISEVASTLCMPEFSGTLLALMGISSGTYIGFKFPEEHA